MTLTPFEPVPKPTGARWLACLLLAALLGGLAAASPARSEPTVRETHKEWAVVCDVPVNSEQEVCLIVQQKNLKENNQPILRMEVGFSVKTGKPFAVITAPLGIALAGGLSMAIDDGESRALQFASCIPNGCIVGMNLSEEQIAGLKRGAEAKFSFQDSRRRTINVPISLQGFTAALQAIAP